METKSRDAYPIIYIGNMRLGTGSPDVGARSDLLAGSTSRLPHFSRLRAVGVAGANSPDAVFTHKDGSVRVME